MANLEEAATYSLGIVQLETNDPALGGPGGIMNAQAQALANRTAWLKAAVEARLPLTGGIMFGGITWVASAADLAEQHRLIPRRYADALRQMGRNRLVNPAMAISQQRGTDNFDATTGDNYVIDQWIAHLSTNPGGTLRMAQVPTTTPGGSLHRLRATVLAADNAIAAGDFYAIKQPVEGNAVADARFGSGSARPLMLRLGIMSSVAGTFGVAIQNSAGDRSYVGTITIEAGEANTDVVKTLAIPGDTAGTWLTGFNMGLAVIITLAAGTSRQTAGGWVGAPRLTTAGQVNFMATAGAVFELFDVGLYVDPLNLGLAPPWEPPDYPDELRKCSRYWQTGRAAIWRGAVANGATIGQVTVPFPVVMRASPAVTLADSGSANFPAGPATVGGQNAAGFDAFKTANASANDAYFIAAWTASARF